MSSNTSVAFGSGVLIATPAGANPTPVQFGTMQDVSIDISFSTKQLMGQYQFPIAVARGEGKISGKAKYANIDGAVFNSLFFGVTETVGQKLWSYNEAATIPSSTPWQVTVANGATFDADLGVTYASSGLFLTRVAAAPTVGQYSVNTTTGVYTFSTTDANKAILINYSYTQTTSGAKSIINNQVMGTAVTFQIDFYQKNPNVAGAQWSLRLYSCMASKLSVASKNSDFTVPELDFEAFANAANNIGEINTATA
jgi:hypothetical protein